VNERRASQPAYQVGSKRDQHVIVRDGARLAVDVFRPFAEGEFPALLAVGPHGKDLVNLAAVPQFPFRETGPIDWYVERGYAYVHMDARGTGKSEGRFVVLDPPFQTDLYDVIEWLADQPWCNGRIGMIGSGFYGVSQWLAAAQRPPHLVCIAPCDAFIDTYRELAYHGGVPSLFPNTWLYDLRARRMLDYPDRHWTTRTPLADALVKRLADGAGGALQEAGLRALSRAGRLMERIRPSRMNTDVVYSFLDNPLDGPFYWIHGAYTKIHNIKTPFYSIANWASIGLHLRGNLLAFEEIDAPKKLLVTGGVGDPTTWRLIDGPEPHDNLQRLFNSISFHEELLRWYDYWLKDLPTGVLEEPAVRYWLQGAGEYRSASAWPPAEVVWKDLYLQPPLAEPRWSLNDGGLAFEGPPEGEHFSAIAYPDGAWSGQDGLGTAVPSQAGVPDRIRRILTFTSAPLEAPLTVTGPIKLTLYASSSETDTDFLARLADQPPLSDDDARLLEQLDLPPQARVVSRGWLRASHRATDPSRGTAGRPWHPHDAATPLEPGQVYPFEIEIWPTAWRFEKGHRVRLEVAPGDSPYFDRPVTHHFAARQGTDRIHHDATHPSHLTLPVLP
jgi:putative CocE/NonD family hydrolase